MSELIPPEARAYAVSDARTCPSCRIPRLHRSHFLRMVLQFVAAVALEQVNDGVRRPDGAVARRNVLKRTAWRWHCPIKDK
ncbi:MAG TPA: hypothetical protein VGD54_18655 [Steroidobacteraceae bacterium]